MKLPLTAGAKSVSVKLNWHVSRENPIEETLGLGYKVKVDATRRVFIGPFNRREINRREINRREINRREINPQEINRQEAISSPRLMQPSRPLPTPSLKRTRSPLTPDTVNVIDEAEEKRKDMKAKRDATQVNRGRWP